MLQLWLYGKLATLTTVTATAVAEVDDIMRWYTKLFHILIALVYQTALKVKWILLATKVNM